MPIPFLEHCGFRLLRCDGERARIEATIEPHLSNAFGVAHGGLLMTLLDATMAHAARSPQYEEDPPRPPVVTLEMKTSFFLPGEGTLRAEGKVLHRTATLVFCEATVTDASGQPVAQSTGTFKPLRGLPSASGRGVHELAE